MALSFNPTALSMFNDAALGNADAIANVSKGLFADETHVVSAGNYKGCLGSLRRTIAEKDANNFARTELLKALGTAFSLKGCTTSQNGSVTFSKHFMDKLEEILGRGVFKREDFGVPGADGSVSSGRPLTQRRITAIINRAYEAAGVERQVGAVDEKEELGVIEFESGKKPFGDFNVGEYRAKFAAMVKDLGMPGAKGTPQVIGDVGAGLDFMVSTKGQFFRNHPSWDFNYLELQGDAKEVKRSVVNQGSWIFQYRDVNGEYKPYKNAEQLTDIRDGALRSQLGGNELIHVEWVHFDPTGNGADDIRALQDYVNSNVKSFVKLAIDVYEEAKQAGKLAEFKAHLENPGACMEDKIKKFCEFREQHLSGQYEKVDKVLAAKLESIANGGTGDQPVVRRAENGIYDVLNEVFAMPGSDKWGWKEAGPIVKERLVGKMFEISTPVKNEQGTYDFKPVLANGVPVVRKLTEEDVEKIGKACLVNIEFEE